MIQRAKTFFAKIWHAAPVATVVLIVALAASTLFGVRTVVFWHRHPDWNAQAKEVAPWMTPRFISRAWHIPPDDVLKAIDAPVPPPNGPMSLEELAQFRGVPLEQVMDEINALIESMQSGGEPRP